jgi:brefeldin A-inhibited guanine nucleotide-exchange protein
MASGEEVERPAGTNGAEGDADSKPEYRATEENGGGQYASLAGDKEELNYKRDFNEIKIADVPAEVSPNTHGSASPAYEEEPEEAADIEILAEQRQESTSPAPPPPPEKDDRSLPQPTPRSIGALPSATTSNGTDIRDRERSDSASTQATQATTSAKRPSAPLSSIIFVVSALEQIAASKEARKRGKLGEAAQRALDAIKRLDGSPSPDVIFEPLRLATETSSIPLATTALDCIGKLISYSYFSVPAEPQDPTAAAGQQQQLPLIDRAIETICECFQNEATPYEVQLQIVKSLLAAVLNDKLIVHGSGLLKAVRQVYNIFLLSKSNTNQQVAQGTLTQMVGTVFERVSTRLAMREARLNLARMGSGKGTVNSSQVEVNGSSPVLESNDRDDGATEQDGTSEGNSTVASDQPVPKEPSEKLTLQSLENAKSFDDRKIGDNAPTMVTPAKPPLKTLRSASGQPAMTDGDEEPSRPDTPNEDEDDEIYVKDAFLVFRSMCRLSHKELPPQEQQDIHSSNMRSKLVSLAIIRTTLNNHMAVFTSPLCTIRGTNNEPTSFGQAINQYLRLSVSRNGASSVRRVFETCAEIFWLMLKDMRVMLKVCHPHHYLIPSMLTRNSEKSSSS